LLDIVILGLQVLMLVVHASVSDEKQGVVGEVERIDESGTEDAAAMEGPGESVSVQVGIVETIKELWDSDAGIVRRFR
jgi:hypothetical protein